LRERAGRPELHCFPAAHGRRPPQRRKWNGVFESSFDKKDNAGTLTATGAVIDASGGWWDAGDYMKFVQTHSYTVALMLIGVRDFPNQMGAGSSSSNFTAEARFGLDWLQKMWSDSNQTLYYR
jgi:endoglucanase